MGKKKDIDFSSSRPSLSKKGKGQFNQFMRKGGAVSRPIQRKKLLIILIPKMTTLYEFIYLTH